MAALTGLSPVAAAPAQADPTGSAEASTSAGVDLQVVSVSQPVPPATAAPTTIQVVLSLSNATPNTITGLRLTAQREATVTSQSRLADLVQHPTRATSLLSALPAQELPQTLAPRSSIRVTYPLIASTDSTLGGSLCLCQAGVYPVDFAVSGSAGNQSTGNQRDSTELGWAQTYISSLPDSLPTQVSWLWPLIDRPHRLIADNVFLDDQLASSVSPGGRLDRALQVVEQVGVRARFTLVIDPELIDELAVMTTGYQVIGAHGTRIPGTGGPAAAKWLSRLHRVLSGVDVTMTPYADPDVNAATRAGLSWAPTTAAAVQRIAAALGADEGHAIAWPPGETVTSASLGRLTAAGASSVVLNDQTLPAGSDDSAAANGLATLPGGSGTALVVRTQLQRQAAAVIDLGSAGTSALPGLLAEMSIPAIADPSTSHFLVLVPDRNVDADPASAAQGVELTTSGQFSPLSATQAPLSVTPVSSGSLTGATSPELSQTLIEASRTATRLPAALGSTVAGDQSSRVLAGFGAAAQRALSAGWLADPSAGSAYATALDAASAGVLGGVAIAPPNRPLSLASNDAPLYIVVVNSFPVAVNVQVTLSSTNGLVGFHTDDLGVQQIAANSSRTLRIQAHVNRSGHFTVDARVSTPQGTTLGAPLKLSVYSKALGTIGVVITVVAGAVLALALLLRFSRRIREHSHRTADARIGGSP